MQEAVDQIYDHSHCQRDFLGKIYAYLRDLNTAHIAIRDPGPDCEAESHAHNDVDAFHSYRQVLSTWSVPSPHWCFEGDVTRVVALACLAETRIAYKVWAFFQRLRWRHPDHPNIPGDFGITWVELAVHFMLFSGQGLPLWIANSHSKILEPYAFDSPEALLQPKSAHGLCYQASTLRGIVRYLEGTMQCQLFPRYKKTCASSLVRLGFHRTLVGGIAARPSLPYAAQAVKIMTDYAALPEQPYPRDDRFPLPICTDFAETFSNLPAEIPFRTRYNLYQKVKKYIRLKKPLDELAPD